MRTDRPPTTADLDRPGIPVVCQRVQVPPPPPGAPTPFKYAAPGSISADLEEAGFKGIEEETRELPFPWASRSCSPKTMTSRAIHVFKRFGEIPAARAT